MKKIFGCICLLAAIVPATLLAGDNPNVYTYRMGNVEICLLSEGQGTGNSRIFVGATPQMIEKYLPNGSFPISCNAFLIRMNGKVILVDTGYGRNLFDNMKSLGVKPDEVDVLLLTHVHGDHVGGMLKDNVAAFPKAALYMSQAEYDFCMNSERNAGARKAVEAYRSRLHLFQPAEIDAQSKELFAGFRAIASYGHTPGHTSYLIEQGGQKLLIWGDITHAMAIQMPCPQVAMTYDSDPDMAIASRKKILEYVAKNGIPVAGMHTAYPGMGKVTKGTGDGFEYAAFQ